MEYLRDQVSVVLQKNVLFSGTILDNLRWGNENATDAACIEACEAACADEFIERFPESMKLISSRAAQTYQADRSSDFVSQERF